jgi:hypothetical protein
MVSELPSNPDRSHSLQEGRLPDITEILQQYIKIRDLVPGDKLTYAETCAIYIGRITPHPLYSHLWLIIWWMVEEQRYSFDALSPLQEVPGTLDINYRYANLRKVFNL